MLLVKETKKLFMDKYGHKIVFVQPASGWFRGGKISYAREKIKNFKFGGTDYFSRQIKSQQDLDYSLKLCNAFESMTDYEIRVESPCLSFYTNNPKDIDKIAKIAGDNVKYICKPPVDKILSKKTVLMRRTGYDYKVTLGSTKNEYHDFIEWADKTGHAKLTKSTRRELSRSNSWGGTYFYVKDDKSLTMTKMFLGGCISRVDQVVQPTN
jgi:hypothetical protein